MQCLDGQGGGGGTVHPGSVSAREETARREVRRLRRREKSRRDEDTKGGASTVEKPAWDRHSWHERSGGARGVVASMGKRPALRGFEGGGHGGMPGDGSDGAWGGRSVERSAASRRNRHESPALEKKMSGERDEDATVVARDFEGGVGRRQRRHVSPETKEKRGRGLPAFVRVNPQRRGFFSMEGMVEREERSDEVALVGGGRSWWRPYGGGVVVSKGSRTQEGARRWWEGTRREEKGRGFEALWLREESPAVGGGKRISVVLRMGLGKTTGKEKKVLDLRFLERNREREREREMGR